MDLGELDGASASPPSIDGTRTERMTDVSSAAPATTPLRESSRRTTTADELLLLIDQQHRVVQVSDRMRHVTRLRPGDHVELDPGHFLDAAEGAAIVAAYGRVRVRPGTSERTSLRIADRQGIRRQLDLTIANRLDDPAVGAIEVTGTEVTHVSARRVVARLRDRLLDLLPTVVTVVDDVGTIVYCSPRSEVVLGRSPSELIGRAISETDLLPIGPDDVEAIRSAAETTGRWEGDVDLRRKDGSTVPVQLILERIDDDEIGFHGTVGISFDITERRKLEEHLDFQAGHDALTGLFNRQRFVRLLERALIDVHDRGRHVAVFFVDLDDFKTVNDRIGHAAGDAVLAAVAAQLRAVLPPECVAARFGGDEFVFYLPGLVDVGPAVVSAQRLLDALAEPVGSGADALVVSGSVGIALSSPGAQAEELLRRSDLAMYAAKDGGKNRIEVFDDEVGHRRRREREMIDELARALADDELTVCFQPEMSLRDGRVAAFEALVRWDHPVRGRIPPSEFVPIAEESGLIHQLGHLVLDRSCRAMRGWLDQGLADGVMVAVNVSARQLLDHDFPNVVDRLVTDWRVPAGHVCLEVTESALVDADVASRALSRLDAIGVTIAIDDFGTGYSSLSRLSQYPLDFLKIDRSFVADLATEPASAVIVQMVIDLAHALGLQAIAEGIETDEQLIHLAAAGCDIGQGFLWSPAVTVDVATAMLRRQPFVDSVRVGRRGVYRGVPTDVVLRRHRVAP